PDGSGDCPVAGEGLIATVRALLRWAGPPARDTMAWMRKLGLVAFTAVLLAGAAETFLKDDKLVSSVEGKVRKVLPTRAEKRYDDIGWAPSIVAGEATAAKVNRPLFLFV